MAREKLPITYSTRSKVLNCGSANPATRQSCTTLQHLIVMATPRRFGQEINGNVRRGPNSSPAARSTIIAKW
jgi:tRNA A37 threonylcarbamoyladenosine synthetase subunit TsaC/SUA5/YrdC